MTGKKESSATWHRMTVVLRSDIHQQALEQGIDINDACNRVLAGLTGTEYHRQVLEDAPAPAPVIIARAGSSPPAPGEFNKSLSENLHPVINADDPAAPDKVVQAKTQKAKKAPAESPAPVPAPAPFPPKEKSVAAPAATTKKTAVQKGHTAASKKRSKGDILKMFFASKIARTDDAGDSVAKDDLYEILIRFCRDHRITPVPEKKAVTVALKNQFALTERLVDGRPCWNGIRWK